MAKIQTNHAEREGEKYIKRGHIFLSEYELTGALHHHLCVLVYTYSSYGNKKRTMKRRKRKKKIKEGA